ncbi:hypothetical protein pb186bvf_012311 [Paramecium bursaria]
MFFLTFYKKMNFCFLTITLTIFIYQKGVLLHILHYDRYNIKN